jgi:hypothetical protein
MANFVRSLCLALVVIVSAGCSAETAQRTAYEALQGRHEQDCLRYRAADCGKKQGYDDYQRERKQRSDASD